MNEIKNPEKIHRIHAPAVIDADRRQLEADEPIWSEWWNNFSNLYCEYYMKHGEFPNYAYVNERVWEDANNELTRGWSEKLPVEVLTHPMMPWRVVAMHMQKHHPSDVAAYYRQRTNEELLDSGKAVLV